MTRAALCLPAGAKPSLADAEVLVRERRHGEAAALYQRLAQQGPPDGLDARSLGNYGGLLADLRRFDEAVEVLSRAVTLDPSRPASWLNLGIALMEQQRYDDAIAALSNSLRLRPSHGGALAGLGVALDRCGAHTQAVTFFDLALQHGEGWPQVRFNRAIALLAAGRYREGFEAFEARHALHAPRFVGATRWDGSPLEGRTLLVHGEQGLGDVLQFARFLPFAKSRGGRVVLCVARSLVALLSGLDGVDEVVDDSQPPPAHDLVCPIMSLARLVATTPQTIPAAAGYLRADPALAEAWRRRLAAHECRDQGARPLRIGLVWAGGRIESNRDYALIDTKRSLPLAALGPLAEAVPQARFHSLQIGAPSSEARYPPPGMQLVDLTAHITSFADTAGLISLLDLVISVDTSAAHLAGALGRPVWMLSRFDACWRWRLAPSTTPWYNSMRLYAQPAPGDWATPLAAMAADLRAFAPA